MRCIAPWFQFYVVYDDFVLIERPLVLPVPGTVKPFADPSALSSSSSPFASSSWPFSSSESSAASTSSIAQVDPATGMPSVSFTEETQVLDPFLSGSAIDLADDQALRAQLDAPAEDIGLCVWRRARMCMCMFACVSSGSRFERLARSCIQCLNAPLSLSFSFFFLCMLCLFG